MTATFFPNQAAFRAWLETHHATATELLVGFHKVPKKGAAPEPGRSTLTWPQSVDEAPSHSFHLEKAPEHARPPCRARSLRPTLRRALGRLFL
ncbi:MAG: hypothetical protein U0271_35200 [Polyangiaceae bacterium]